MDIDLEGLLSRIDESVQRLGDAQLAELDPQRTLKAIVTAVLAGVPAAAAAAVALYDSDRIGSITGSDEVVEALEAQQVVLGEGPALTAVAALAAAAERSGNNAPADASADAPADAPADASSDAPAAASGDVAVGAAAATAVWDLHAAPWPRFAAVALEAGYAAVMSVPLSRPHPGRGAGNLGAREPAAAATGEAGGVLSLYGVSPRCFSTADALLASVIAAQATIALVGAQRAAAGTRRAGEREIIATARGVLMQRWCIDEQAASVMLARAARVSNTEVHDTAARVLRDVHPRHPDTPTDPHVPDVPGVPEEDGAPLLLRPGHSTRPAGSVSAVPASQRVAEPVATVRRALAYMDAHAHLDVGIAQIAEAAGVGPRALQQTFRAQLGQTPLGYLRRVRMRAAHRDLHAADPTRGDTVAEIAARWRFHHAGRFAVQYRKLYACSPSHTLRR